LGNAAQRTDTGATALLLPLPTFDAVVNKVERAVRKNVNVQYRNLKKTSPTVELRVDREQKSLFPINFTNKRDGTQKTSVCFSAPLNL
jgi:hypothetical protein